MALSELKMEDMFRWDDEDVYCRVSPYYGRTCLEVCMDLYEGPAISDQLSDFVSTIEPSSFNNLSNKL